jgi:hypothetical protein
MAERRATAATPGGPSATAASSGGPSATAATAAFRRCSRLAVVEPAVRLGASVTVVATACAALRRKATAPAVLQSVVAVRVSWSSTSIRSERVEARRARAFREGQWRGPLAGAQRRLPQPQSPAIRSAAPVQQPPDASTAERPASLPLCSNRQGRRMALRSTSLNRADRSFAGRSFGRPSDRTTEDPPPAMPASPVRSSRAPGSWCGRSRA